MVWINAHLKENIVDEKLVDELWEYAENMLDEYGEYVVQLCELHRDKEQMSPLFKREYENELKRHYDYFKANYVIIERVVPCERRITELEKIE